MAFFANDAVNRVNLHSGIQALAQSGGGVFLMVVLLRGGVPLATCFLTFAALFAGRFVMRPAILPLARRFGMKPLLLVGNFGIAVQYPLLAAVHGVGSGLVAWCAVSSIADILYWPTYNAYVSAVGDSEHRGHQLGARAALESASGIVAPLLGAWALAKLGPGPAMAAAGGVQLLAVLPLVGAPNVAVVERAQGAIRAARLGAILSFADGWFDTFFLILWQAALFFSLGSNVTAYGGAMALAGLVGAVAGPVLGRAIDLGGGRRAVRLAYVALAMLLLIRAASLGSPWLAVAANAAGALLGTLMLPASTAITNLAKASPCPYRFTLATEGGWDIGFASASLLVAALAGLHVPLPAILPLGLAATALAAFLLDRHYGDAVGLADAETG